MIRFKLKISETPYWFWVIIHDDVKQLRKAALKHEELSGAPMSKPGAGDETGYFGRTIGITHRFERVVYDKDGVMRDHGNTGIIRFAPEHLNTEIAAHELMHAVSWTFKRMYGPNMGNAYKQGWREEKLARIYGATFASLNSLLYKKNGWQ